MAIMTNTTNTTNPSKSRDLATHPIPGASLSSPGRLARIAGVLYLLVGILAQTQHPCHEG